MNIHCTYPLLAIKPSFVVIGQHQSVEDWYLTTILILFCPSIVAARVFSKKDHVLQGFPLCLAYVQKPVDEPKARNKLLIRNTPPGIDREYLLLFLESVLEMEETDFTVTVLPDQLALIVFHNDFTVEGITDFAVVLEHCRCKI